LVVTIPSTTAVIIPSAWATSISHKSIVTVPTPSYSVKFSTPFVTPNSIPFAPTSRYIVVSTIP
jgi:hypothetical protein